MTMEERIDRLEEEVVRYRRLLGVAGLAGFIIIACAVVSVSLRPTPVEAQTGLTADKAGAPPPEEIRTPRSIIVDKDGRERAMLTALKEGPGLWLLDENASPRAMLATTREGPMLVLSDEKGKAVWKAP